MRTVAAVAASLLLITGCNNDSGVAPYKNCTEAGHPITKTDPRWNPKLDRDGDGRACEK